MACKLDVRTAVFDKVFEELAEGRYSFSRTGEDTIRVNSRGDNAKARAKSASQAKAMAHEMLKRARISFEGHVDGYVNQHSTYDPVTITFTVSDAYVQHEFDKLNVSKDTQAAPMEAERDFINTSTDYDTNRKINFAPATRPELGMFAKYLEFKQAILDIYQNKLHKVRMDKKKVGVSIEELKALNKEERRLELFIEGSPELRKEGLKDQITRLSSESAIEAVRDYVRKDLDRLPKLVLSDDIDDVREAERIIQFYKNAGNFTGKDASNPTGRAENPFFPEDAIFFRDDEGELTTVYKLGEDIRKQFMEWRDEADGYTIQAESKKKEITVRMVNSNPGVVNTYGKNKKFTFSELVYEKQGLEDIEWVTMWTMDITSGIFSHNGLLPQVIFSHLNNSIERKAEWARAADETIDKLAPKAQEAIRKTGDPRWTHKGLGIRRLGGTNWNLYKETTKNGNETNCLVQRFTREFNDAYDIAKATFQEVFDKAKVISGMSEKVTLAFRALNMWRRQNTILFEINRMAEILDDPELADLFTEGKPVADAAYRQSLIDVLGKDGYEEQIEEQKRMLRKYLADRQNVIDIALGDEGKFIENGTKDDLNDAHKAALQEWEYKNDPLIGIEGYNSTTGYVKDGLTRNNFMGYNNFIARKRKANVTYATDSTTGKSKFVVTETNEDTDYYSEQYATIEANDDLLAFYNVMRDVCVKIKESIPYHLQKDIPSHTLPGLEKTMGEMLADKEMGLLKRIFSKNGAIAALWERIRRSVGVVNQADVSSAKQDPITGKYNNTVNDAFLRNNSKSIRQRQTIEQQKFLIAYNSNKADSDVITQIRKFTILELKNMTPDALLLLAQYTHTDLSVADARSGNIAALQAKIGDKVSVGRIIKEFSVHSIVQAQSFDLPKLAKYFANMTMAYAARNEALPFLEIVKKHYEDIQAPRTNNVNKSIRHRFNKIIGKVQMEGPRENARKQVENWFQRVVLNNYGVKHKILLGKEDEGARFGRHIYSREERKRLNEINKLLEDPGVSEQVKDELRASKKAMGKVRTASALIEGMFSWIRFLKLGYNLPSSITNFMEGVTSNVILAASGEYFDEKELMYGYRVVRSSFVRNLSFGLTGYEPKLAKRCRKLMDKFNVVMDSKNELQRAENSTGSNRLSWLGSYELNQRVEYINQSPLMVAMLRTMKIKDKSGVEKSVWDAHDENGDLLPEFSYDEAQADTYTDEQRDRLIQNNQDWKMLAGENYEVFKNKLNKVIGIGHGMGYDELRGMMAKSSLLGKAAMMFKTWMPSQFYQRFAVEQDDISTGTIGYKGRYLSYGTGTATVAGLVAGAALFGTGVGLIGMGALGMILGKYATKTNTDISLVREMATTTGYLFLKMLGMPINFITGFVAGKQVVPTGNKAFENWVGKGNFTTRDAKNLRANLADMALQLAWIALTMMVKAMLYDDEDDDDKDSPARAWHNIIVNKLIQLSHSASMYCSIPEIWRSTVGSLSIKQYLDDVVKWMDAIHKWSIDQDSIAGGVNRGRSGLGLATEKIFMPGLFKDLPYLGFEAQAQRVFEEPPWARWFKSEKANDETYIRSARSGRRLELENYDQIKAIQDEKLRTKTINKILDYELPTVKKLEKMGRTRDEYEDWLEQQEYEKVEEE